MGFTVDSTDFSVVLSSHMDEASARRRYQELRATCRELTASDLDLVIVGRSDAGEMRILRRHEFTATFGTTVGEGWGIATGLALALFPASAEGTGYRTGAAGEAAVLATIAEAVRGAMGWDQLRLAGEQIDSHEATVISSVPRSLCDQAPSSDPDALTTRFDITIDLAGTHVLIDSTFREATT